MNMESIKIDELAEKVERLEQIAREIFDQSDNFPALNRNAKRILASTKMLKINLGE